MRIILLIILLILTSCQTKKTCKSPEISKKNLAVKPNDTIYKINGQILKMFIKKGDITICEETYLFDYEELQDSILGKKEDLNTTFKVGYNHVSYLKFEGKVLKEKVYGIKNIVYYDSLGNMAEKHTHQHIGSPVSSWKVYYPNGNIRHKGQTEDKASCIFSSGDFLDYFEDGTLARKTSYTNKGDGCHDIIIFIKDIVYYKNKEIKFIKEYKGNHQFSIDDKDHSGRYGNWKFYNRTGELIRTEKYPKFKFDDEK